jgi:hypothetical protein
LRKDFARFGRLLFAMMGASGWVKGRLFDKYGMNPQ